MTKKAISELFTAEEARELFENQFPMLRVKSLGEPVYSVAPYSNDEYAAFVVYAALLADEQVVNKYHVLMWWDVNEQAVRLTLPDGYYQAYVKDFAEWLSLAQDTQMAALTPEQCRERFTHWLASAQ